MRFSSSSVVMVEFLRFSKCRETARVGKRRTLISLLAPQGEFLLHRTVGKTEQDRFLGRLVAMPMPAWHHENVVCAPVEGRALDYGDAAALDHGVNRAVG